MLRFLSQTSPEPALGLTQEISLPLRLCPIPVPGRAWRVARGQGPGCWPQPPISGAGVGWPEVSKHFPTHLIQPFWMGTCLDKKGVKGRCGRAERQTRMQKQPLSGRLWLQACKTALHSQQPAVLCVLQGFTVYMCKLRDRILKAHCEHVLGLSGYGLQTGHGSLVTT